MKRSVGCSIGWMDRVSFFLQQHKFTYLSQGVELSRVSLLVLFAVRIIYHVRGKHYLTEHFTIPQT